MKKIFKLLSVILCLSMLLTFIGCDKSAESNTETTETTEAAKEPETVEELWDRVDSVMDALTSYDYKTVGQLDYYYGGTEVNVSILGNGVFCALEDDYYEYSDSITNMVIREYSVEQKFEASETYYNGKKYVKNVSGDSVQMLCSPITYEEYQEDSETVLSSFDEMDCKNRTFEKHDDGTWTINLSGYTKKALNEFIDGVGMGDEDMGAGVIDMELTVTVDSEYHAAETAFNMQFDVDDDMTPVFTLVVTYGGFNTTEPNYDQLKPDEYKEVEDVRILDTVKDYLTGYTDEKSGQFKLELDQTLTAAGETSEYGETNYVTFSEEKGSFIFDIKLEGPNSEPGAINYKNGVENILYEGEEYTQAMSDDEARQFIIELMNVRYDATRVTDIAKIEDGIYSFTVDTPDSSYYESYFGEQGVKYESMTQNFTVIMDGERVVRITTDVVANGVYNDVAENIPVVLDLTVTLDFSDFNSVDIKA